ncbi:MAG TPA: ATP-binding protein [Rhodocyclaceae bacterium]|nr:ATP-binding protein [Rhodocyclaceae bacterium]
MTTRLAPARQSRNQEPAGSALARGEEVSFFKARRLKLAPGSLLARTFLLIAALVILTTAAWLSLFRYADAVPRAHETAQLATSAVNLIRAALIASAPERRLDLFIELTTREGIRLLPAEDNDQVEELPDSRFLTLVRQEIVSQLGPKTRVAMEVNGTPGFWVSFRLEEHDEDEFWLVLPRERAVRKLAWHWLTWGLLALGLALAVAWYIVSRINRPLKALAKAAGSVGRGQMPEPLPETGAEELQRLAAAFNRMASDLARHERDRAEVLAGISHDLRTPLTRLRLEAEMSVSDPASREGIVADIEQMEAVISQFMDYARGDGGEPAQATDLSHLLQDIATRQVALGRALSFVIPPLPTVEIRPKALARAVTNLIDNAYKYGGGDDVQLQARESDGMVTIEVQDRGPGIPAEEAERLKLPFTRLENARTDATGTGLGLAIVDRIARLHGGSLELLPRDGGGLTARIVFPAA